MLSAVIDEATTDATTEAASRRFPADGAADLLGPAVIVITVIVAFVWDRTLWFFSDDWNIISGWPSGGLLEPFNSHLSLVPIGVYQTLFHTVGLDDYTPYRVAGLAAYALLGWVTWRFARGHVGAVGGAIATAAVLWHSAGVTNLLFPFLMNFSIPVAALVAVWWHLDRDTVRHDAFAALWICLALATSGLGLMVAVAVGVELVWHAVTRRSIPWQRWAFLAPGPVLWFVWYLAFGVDSPASGGLRPIASYTARMLLGGVSGLVGGNRWLGAALAAFVTGLIVGAVVRRAFDARIAGALAAPVAFAGLTAVSRIGVVPAIPPDELRYQWTIGAFLVFAIVLLLVANGPLTPPTNVAVAVVASLAVIVGAVQLADDGAAWVDTVEQAVPGVRANLLVAEMADAAGVLDRDRALPVSYVKVTAGEYVDAVAKLGSPLTGFSADDFGGSVDSMTTAEQAFVDDFTLVVRPDGPESCGEPRPLPAGPIEVHSGEVYRIVAGESADVRFGLFGPLTAHGHPGVIIGTLAAGEEGFVTVPDLGRAPRVTPYIGAANVSVDICP